jgi:BlaI family penicillinase repressor
MAATRLTKLELQIMEVFWTRGACSVREIQEAFPEVGRPAYTTIQTTVYRLEAKGAVRIVKRISNANIFEPVISRDEGQGRLVDELLALLGGKTKPVMAHLVKTGQLTLADIQEAERALRQHQKEHKRK